MVMDSIVRRKRERETRTRRANRREFERLPGLQKLFAGGMGRVWLHQRGRVRVIEIVDSRTTTGFWLVERLQQRQWISVGRFGREFGKEAFRMGIREASRNHVSQA